MLQLARLPMTQSDISAARGLFNSKVIMGASGPKTHRFNPVGSSLYSGGRNNEGQPEGSGVMLYGPAQDCCYYGDWRAGKREGGGKMIWNSGDEYEGEWVQDVMSGKGTLTKAVGSTYVGEWMNGNPHGTGKITHSSGRSYEGSFVNGVSEGAGKFRFDNGTIYQGNWKDGAMVDSGEVFKLKSSALLSSSTELDEAGRRSSMGGKGGFRSSLINISDFESSYQIYPKNFKDFVVLTLVLFALGVSIFLIFHQV